MDHRGRSASGAPRGLTGNQEGTQFTGDFGFGLALCGSVFTALGFIYFANSSDLLIRKHTFKTMSASIPIFCGVLVYSFSNNLVISIMSRYVPMQEPMPLDEWLSDCFLRLLPRRLPYSVVIRFLHAIALHAVFRCTVRFLARWARIPRCWQACCPGRENRSSKGDDDAASATATARASERVQDARRRMLGVRVLAYANGFAAAEAWTSLQDEYCSSWLKSFALVAIAMIVYTLVALADHLMWCLWSALTCHTELLDAEALRSDVVAEGENDAVALIGSYLFVRSVRMQLGGEQSVQDDHWATSDEACCLWAFHLLMFTLFGIYRSCIAALPSFGHGCWRPLQHRLTEVVTLLFAMTSCWSCYWALTAAVEVFLQANASHESAVWQLHAFRAGVIAVLSSLWVFLYLWIGVKVIESACVRNDTKEKIEHRMSFCALLVGFSWEKLFHQSIESTSHQSMHPLLTEFVLSVFAVGLVVPGWRAYIAPMEENGYNFGFVPELVVDMARRTLMRQGSNSVEYRKAYSEMLRELSLALTDDEQTTRSSVGAMTSSTEAAAASTGRGDILSDLGLSRLPPEKTSSAKSSGDSQSDVDLSRPLLEEA